MKTITNETKARIFAMYLGQNFVAVNDSDDEDTDYKKGDFFKLTLVNYGNICIQANSDQENWNLGLEKEYAFLCDWFETKDFKLQLKELSNITQDDLNEIAEIIVAIYPENFIESLIYKDKPYGINPNKAIRAYQYLQSKGYAMPYINYTVEDLVELGIYTLKK